MGDIERFEPPSGGYGRIWRTMYNGSMVGAGPEVFCLWPYVISNMMPDAEHGATVLLNPGLLATIFGTNQEFVTQGIQKLQAPDPNTRNGLSEEGRRLVHLAGFLYRVVNGVEYRKIRAREAHAAAQARHYAKKRKRGARSQQSVREDNEARERRFVEASDRGDDDGADRIAAEGIP